MAADMDIEMDLDIGMTGEDLTIPETEIIPDIELSVSSNVKSYKASTLS
jgi:hypothetical protein